MTIQQLIKQHKLVEVNLRQEISSILPLNEGEHYVWDLYKVSVKRVEQGKVGNTLKALEYTDSRFKKALSKAISEAIGGLTALRKQMTT